jgi:glycosyltransferase involved in cell wall biosynthesis
MKLTFGIPVYNGEKYLKKLLSSFDVETSMNYEVLIIDDGSTDETPNVLKSINNEKIRFLIKKNEGVSETRNKLIKNASGNWITFVDVDDIIDLKEYEKAFENLMSQNTYFHINVHSEYHLQKLNKSKNKISYLIEKEIINSPWTKFYNLESLKKSDISFNSKISLGEDLLFNLQFLSVSKKTTYFHSKMYFYNQDNENSLSRKYRKNKFQELIDVNNKCTNLFKDAKILKSLEFIKIKNMISCIRDEYNQEMSTKELVIFLKSMKKRTNNNYIFLNSISTTMLNLVFWFLPDELIIILLKLRFEKK